MHFEHAQAPALDAYEESLLAAPEQDEEACYCRTTICQRGQ